MLLKDLMPPPVPTRPPLFFLLFFAIFGCIGVTVLVFLWGHHDGFGAPPLIFKFVGSFIALGFIAMGFGLPLSILRKGGTNLAPTAPGQERDDRSTPDYDCPNCGANVQDAEVSPSGDVKCPYCKGWWNVHGKG